MHEVLLFLKLVFPFPQITDEHVKLLGLSPKYGRPDWMIVQVLPVPPIQVRPSIALMSDARAEDDLTHKLGLIIKVRRELISTALGCVL